MYVCGKHSTKQKEYRKTLPKNPNKKQNEQAKYDELQQLVEEQAAENKKAGKKGQVICSKLRMMRNPEHKDGFLKVFPNFKHGGRRDGFGCPSLSPKSMGPVHHTQPSLPPSKNLENLHQGNKVFPSEVDEKGEATKVFFKTQKDMYESNIPLRHKAAAEAYTKGVKNKNVPLYSLWEMPDGSKKKMTYFESRQIYCNYYERFALASDDFKKLKKMREDGYNLQIVGYDAYDVTTDLETCYKDVSRPFGHELVLYTLLTVDDDKEYPWRKYTTLELFAKPEQKEEKEGRVCLCCTLIVKGDTFHHIHCAGCEVEDYECCSDCWRKTKTCWNCDKFFCPECIIAFYDKSKGACKKCKVELKI